MQKGSSKDRDHCLQSWLLLHRNTPHASTGVAPSVLMFGRRTRTALSLVNPLSCKSRMQKDNLTKEQQVNDSRERSFKPGDKILMFDENKKKWREGTVLRPEGSIMYEIETEYGRERKHLDQLVARHDRQLEPASREIVTDSTAVNRSLESQPPLTSEQALSSYNDCTSESDKIEPNISNSKGNPALLNKGSNDSSQALPVEHNVRRSTRERSTIERTNYTKLGG